MALVSNPIHNLVRLSSAAAITSIPGRVFAVLLEGGTDASSIDFTNDADGNGTPVVGVTAPFTDTDASAAGTVFVDFTSLGGVNFSSKIYGKLAGTGAIAYVWYDA